MSPRVTILIHPPISSTLHTSRAGHVIASGLAKCQGLRADLALDESNRRRFFRYVIGNSVKVGMILAENGAVAYGLAGLSPLF